jgi:CRISPR/Cas system-associated exonuclease Cas4 (RecB family)
MAKTLVWIDDKLAKELKVVNDTIETDYSQIVKIAKALKDNIEEMKEFAGTDLEEYRFFCQQTRKLYEKVAEEEYDKTEEMFTQLNNKREEVRDKVESIRKNTSELKWELEQVGKILANVNLYGIDRLLKLIEEIHCMNDGERKLLRDVLDLKIYKVESNE